MNPGVYPDLPMKDYHAIDAASSSALREIRAGCPAMVPWKREHPDEDTDATIIGSAAHMMVLQSDLFDATYAMKPDGMSFATKEGKAWRDDPIRFGRQIITAKHGEIVRGVAEAVAAHSVAGDALKLTKREVTLVWIDPDTGLLCKARPDAYDSAYIYDLKITVKADPSRFAYAAFVAGWYHQLAWYRTGAHLLDLGDFGGRLVAVHSQPPHSFRVNCSEVKESTLDMCGMENANALRVYRECKDSGNWPGYPESWQKVEIPAGALSAMTFDMDALAEAV